MIDMPPPPPPAAGAETELTCDFNTEASIVEDLDLEELFNTKGRAGSASASGPRDAAEPAAAAEGARGEASKVPATAGLLLAAAGIEGLERELAGVRGELRKQRAEQAPAGDGLLLAAAGLEGLERKIDGMRGELCEGLREQRDEQVPAANGLLLAAAGLEGLERKIEGMRGDLCEGLRERCEEQVPAANGLLLAAAGLEGLERELMGMRGELRQGLHVAFQAPEVAAAGLDCMGRELVGIRGELREGLRQGREERAALRCELAQLHAQRASSRAEVPAKLGPLVVAGLGRPRPGRRPATATQRSRRQSCNRPESASARLRAAVGLEAGLGRAAPDASRRRAVELLRASQPLCCQGPWPDTAGGPLSRPPKAAAGRDLAAEVRAIFAARRREER
uniref:Uncharacterized protein n=1 Tax=Alexandrium monilatum TaxID=311494 RepID=A0A7S4VV34_9DINO